MPRPRKPTNLHVLQNTVRPHRQTKAEPTPALQIPDPPDFITGAALEEWHRITPELMTLGLLTTIDMAALAGYCFHFGIMKKAAHELEASTLLVETTNGNKIQNPLVGIVNTASKMSRQYLQEFGMSPSSRAGVSAAPVGKKKNKFEEAGL